MKFYEMMEQVLALLQRERRVSYRAPKNTYNPTNLFCHNQNIKPTV